jgi:hypothetical protein
VTRTFTTTLFNNVTLQITNSQLKERAKAFGAGLVRVGLKPQEDNVLLLLQDSIGELQSPTKHLVKFLMQLLQNLSSAISRSLLIPLYLLPYPLRNYWNRFSKPIHPLLSLLMLPFYPIYWKYSLILIKQTTTL